MKAKFDRVDFFAALGLFTGVSAWAFIWAHPCPQPNLWSFLVMVRSWVKPEILGIAGRFALGILAAFTYLVLRKFWIHHRSKDDEKGDDFFYTRTTPICGAVAFVLLPSLWRAGQYLSPGFALLVLSAIGVYLWGCGRGGRGILSYSIAYFIFGGVGALSPFGLIPFVFAMAADSVLRWQDGQAYGQREDDKLAMRRRLVEVWFSFVVGATGFLVGAVVLSSFGAGRGVLLTAMERVVMWWEVWTGIAVKTLGNLDALELLLALVLMIAGLAVGKRIRSIERYGLIMCRVLSAALAIAMVAMMFRAVDYKERIRLKAMRQYAQIVADDAKGAKFIFTDGRFDNLLRLEFAERGMGTIILNTMAAPTQKEAAYLKTVAPELGERAIFELGGAEVFKAWARERPDRLAQSVWQLGGSYIRKYGKIKERTRGSVCGCEAAERSEADDAADSRFIGWTQELLAIADKKPLLGALIGNADAEVAEQFDALLWRAARITGERAGRFAAKKADSEADGERRLMRKIDERNASLSMQGEIVERMLPTEKLVLTSREALEVALKRADFQLAKRYAKEVLAGKSDDSAANFALGMANLEEGEFSSASICFENVLRQNPNDPAALNNLAITYMKLGQGEKALEYAEKAAKIYPSEEVKSTLNEIRKEVGSN